VYYKHKGNIKVSDHLPHRSGTNGSAQPPLPFVLGAEFAGRISQDSPIPKGCHYKAGGKSLILSSGRADKGDKVFGFAQGSFAENLVADWKNLLPIPKGLSFEHACVVPLYVASDL
jgi:NADPH2:quinone reductase